MFKLTLSNPRVWQFQCLRNVKAPHRKGCVTKLLKGKPAAKTTLVLFTICLPKQRRRRLLFRSTEGAWKKRYVVGAEFRLKKYFHDGR